MADTTIFDSNYQHTLDWYRTLREPDQRRIDRRYQGLRDVCLAGSWSDPAAMRVGAASAGAERQP